MPEVEDPRLAAVDDITEQFRQCFNEALTTHGFATAASGACMFFAGVLAHLTEHNGPRGPIAFMQEVVRVFNHIGKASG